jgi:aryl-alcohol dehydrogenase
MTTTAHAAVLRGNDQPFTFEDILLDDIQPTEILVKIVATGLCHTDLAIVHGHIPLGLPIVLGHEGSGIVEQVGTAVTGLTVGDHVAVSFAACGHCSACLAGRETSCEKFVMLNMGGVREDGTGTMTAADGGKLTGSFFGQSSFSSHVVVAARNAVKLPDDFPLEIAGPLGCGIQTGAGTVLNSLNIGAGSSIVIAGVGPVGLSAVMAAKVAGATTIIAVDLLDERLAFATKFGATHIINGTTDDVAATILGLTDGLGADYGVDTTAEPSAIADVLGATRIGASIAVIGVPKPGAVLPLGLFSAGGKTLIGALEGDAVPRTFLPRLIALHADGQFPFDQMITTYPFDQIEQAIADTQSGATVKAVLTMP